LIEETILQEDTIVNIYTLNISIPGFIKQTPLDVKVQVDPQDNNGG
jgi:hypothetical protein